MAKDLNKAMIIGNLTRDPELRTTTTGQQVVSFGVATNRQWKNASGEKQEQVEFHNVVAWGKLAEICAQYLAKGRRAYFEGRLQTQQWEAQDGSKRSRTEIVVDDMILLDGRGGDAPRGGAGASAGGASASSASAGANQDTGPSEAEGSQVSETSGASGADDQLDKSDKKGAAKKDDTDVALDDIPF